MHRKEPLLRAAALFFLCSCGRDAAVPEGAAAAASADAPDLVDEARTRGLDYRNRSGTPVKDTVLEANGAGVALIDLGGDGDLDVVFAQGLPSLGQLLEGPGADLEVFENDGTGHFRRTEGPGLSGWWNGLAVGDVDGDGDADLAAGGFGGVALLLQDERGRLGIAPGTGVVPGDPGPGRWCGESLATGGPPVWATSLAFLDADRDGNLDLYVGQYLDLDPLAPPRGQLGEGPLAVPCRWKGYDVFCGPGGMVPQADRILRGRGDGTFEDRTATWLAGVPAGYTLGVLPFDADGDGDTDLYVANDSSPNLLLVNEVLGAEGGSFVDRAYAAGVALSAEGRAEAGMGVAAGDVDRDGLLDLAVTNFSDEPTELFLGAKRGFVDVTYRLGLHAETSRLLSWGVHLVDFDGDGWLELLTTNGHVYPQADRPHTGTSYGQPVALWRLFPRDRAQRVQPASATSLLATLVGARGSAVGDLDLDGAPDVVVARIDAEAGLGMNRTGPGNRRLALRLLGTAADAGAGSGPRTPADGTGARAVVVVGSGAGEHGLLGEVATACGYQSASTPWLHFGLGREDRYRAIHLRWPSGRIEELPGGPAGRRLWIREGEGVVREEAFR